MRVSVIDFPKAMKGIIVKRAEWKICQRNFFSFQLTGSVCLVQQVMVAAKFKERFKSFQLATSTLSFFKFFEFVLIDEKICLYIFPAGVDWE